LSYYQYIENGRKKMKKTKQTNAKLLVIAITAAAILAAITTTSISGAKPAFARVNCENTPSPDGIGETFVCSGGAGGDTGGSGGHVEGELFDPVGDPGQGETTFSGGGGGNSGDTAGGGGSHGTFDSRTGVESVGGGGSHSIPSH
jgi:hypothetical protein